MADDAPANANAQDNPADNAPKEEGANLSDELKAFLEECENKFASRYTEQVSGHETNALIHSAQNAVTLQDKEFAHFQSLPAVPPPCVHPWNQRPPRNDWRGRGGGGGGHRHGNHYPRGGGGQQHHYRDRSRDHRR